MPHEEYKPVIFLAFANERFDAAQYLRNLGQEQRSIRESLESARLRGHCEYVERSNATLEEIIEVFQSQDYRDRIAVFHFGGHANSYQLMLESEQGDARAADAGGLAAFLGQQRGLQLVFLNGCSTRQHTEALLAANVSAVIATSRAIKDRVAMEFAAHFYRGLAGGASVRKAYTEAEAGARAAEGANFRNAYVEDAPPADTWPWELRVRPGAEITGDWNLPESVGDPLSALPRLAPGLLPEKPFRHLHWFTREDAEVFFGRGYQIRELYDRVTGDDTPAVILLYGQSGVGKSSLLEAGLVPRLEADCAVRYLRRKQEAGLLGTLREAFDDEDSARPLAEAWAAAEARADKPLLVILDQVEEVYTRPGLDRQQEMDEFLSALETLSAARVGGKLILGFRKEWLPEIEQQLKGRKLARSKIFLERLDRKGIVEAVSGVARSKRLSNQYGLTVEDGLAEVIADDLLEDPDSAVAPTLQILLTKMWDEAVAKDRNHPRFDKELYQPLKKQGILLKDFLDQQLDKVRERDREAVESGLALDLLAFHTTPMGTAEQHTPEELENEYGHRRDALDALVQQYKDLYLLSDPSPDRDEASGKSPTRLAHDTLAPLVRKRFSMSVAPGQIARRILENRGVEWQGGLTGTPLDERDLTVVERGAGGMRAPTADEQRLLEASLGERAERERARQRRLKAIGIAIGAVGVLAFVFYLIYRGQTERQRDLDLAQRLADKSLELGLNQREFASLLARQSYLLNKRSGETVKPQVQRALRIAERPFLIILPDQPSPSDGSPSRPDGGASASRPTSSREHVVDLPTFSEDGQESSRRGSLSFDAQDFDDVTSEVRLRDADRRYIFVLPTFAGKEGSDPHFSIAFSLEQKLMASSHSGDPAGTVQLWEWRNPSDAAKPVSDKEGEAVRLLAPSRTLGVGQEVVTLALSHDGQMLATATAKGEVHVWDLRQAGARRIASLPYDKEGYISKLEFSPDGKYVVAGSSVSAKQGADKLLTWDLMRPEYGASVLSFEKATGTAEENTTVAALSFSPDGKTLAACNRTSGVFLWDLFPKAVGTRVVRPTDKNDAMCEAVAFSRDGRALAAGYSYSGDEGHHILVWDATVLHVGAFSVPLLHEPVSTEGVPIFIAFSDAQEWVAADWIADALSGEVSASYHSLNYEVLAERVCSQVKRNLTLGEWGKYVGSDPAYECTCPDLPAGEGAPACPK